MTTSATTVTTVTTAEMTTTEMTMTVTTTTTADTAETMTTADTAETMTTTADPAETMTEQPRPKKRRWSKRAVRATAWATGAAAFISALGAFGSVPPPLASEPSTSTVRPGQRTIQRRIIERIVIIHAAAPAPVRGVDPAMGSTAPAQAPAPAPSTGGS